MLFQKTWNVRIYNNKKNHQKNFRAMRKKMPRTFSWFTYQKRQKKNLKKKNNLGISWILLPLSLFFPVLLCLKRSSIKTKILLMLCSGDKFKHSRLLSRLLSLFFFSLMLLLKGGIFRDLNKINSFLCIITLFLLFFHIIFSTFFFLLSKYKLSAVRLTARIMGMRFGSLFSKSSSSL